ncbi:MAG: hypothetical protein C5B47_07995 [Verrucomicrobia bacterium]|nr:MAG: hypothetical protein C5B47_07995 [Verrucomicrobiota bacterium]
MNQFERDLERFIAGNMDRRTKFHFGYPSAELRRAGVPPYPLMLNQSVIRKILDKHELSVAQLIQVQAALNTPIMIFKSAVVPDAKLLLTQIVVNEKSVVLAIHPGGKMGHKAIVSEVKSVHPRPTEHVLMWMEKGLLLAADKQRSQQWLEDRSRYNSGRYLAIAGQVKSLTFKSQSQGGMKL